MGYKTEKFLGPKLFSLKSRFISRSVLDNEIAKCSRPRES